MNSCKRVALALAALSLAMGGAWAQFAVVDADSQDKVVLKVGDAAPAFQSIDEQGKLWRSSDHAGKILVVYFYPADLTGGCTAQACGFRDDLKNLVGKGVEVVGISGDSVRNHQIFKAVHKLNFTLLADVNGVVAKKFGVPVQEKSASFKTKDENGNAVELARGCTIQRWTFVIGKDGKILQKNTNVSAANDSKKILELIESIK